jgi:uncharacterized protein (TIGR02646 family)
MRFITKIGSGGYHLNHAHENPPTTFDEATSRWRSFGYKAQLQDVLLEEQYGLCCYSELRADLDGLGYHIEHVRPKSLYPGQTFDYANLAASALTEDNLGSFKANNDEIFGGHAKLGKYDPILFISCHDADCSRYFAYLSDGRVVPAYNLNTHERNRADYTIKLLNLNSPYLINRRRRWRDELDQLFDEHENWSLEDLAAIDLLPRNGRLSQFFSATRQFFGRIAEQVIQNGAPELA